MQRRRVKRKVSRRTEEVTASDYFPAPSQIEFIHTGSKLLDLTLGGGWAEGRIANIVGDKSTSKTGLAIEAAANFAAKHPDGYIRYCECEAAFDPQYAKLLGLPVERVDFGEPVETVEELFNDITKALKSKKPTLYIVDSLDALSDRSEMERDMEQGSFGAEKAKKLSQLFRRLVRQMHSTNLTLIIISQVRSKIGLSFGRNTTRSGGRALDFYASQVLYLSHKSTIQRTIGAVKRPVGIEVKAKCDKNKVSLPMREVTFSVRFGFGIDDLASCIDWLKEIGKLSALELVPAKTKQFVRECNELPMKEYSRKLSRVHKVVTRNWVDIEKGFMPKHSKYGGVDDEQRSEE